MIPFVKIMVNIIRNEIVCRGQGMNIGVARIKALSTSKIIYRVPKTAYNSVNPPYELSSLQPGLHLLTSLRIILK